MYKILRYFNQNRKKITTIVIFIAFGFIILQFANYKVANNIISIKNNLINNNVTVKNNINVESAITGKKGSISSTKEISAIEKFIQYCNNGNILEAYNMLSKESQESKYLTEQEFIELYYKNIFENSKSYNIQRWSGSIYKVDFKPNIIHTGKVTSESKQDFITVVYQDNEYKLNINNYIGRKELNKKNVTENITIEVHYKYIFKDYETYVFEVKNNSNTDIYLDNLKDPSTIYIVDGNDRKHIAYMHEIGQEELHIYPNTEKQVKITFSSNYITGRKFSEIVFENVIFKETKNEAKKIVININ